MIGKSDDGVKLAMVFLIDKAEASKMFDELKFGTGIYNSLPEDGHDGEGEFMMHQFDFDWLKSISNFINYKGAETELDGCETINYYVALDTITMDEN
jgi:hypothetical protein